MQPCRNYCFRPVKAGSGASIDHGEKRDNDRVVGTRLFFTSADFKSNGIISTKDISYCKKTFPTCLLTWMRLLMTDVILLDAPDTHTKKKDKWCAIWFRLQPNIMAVRKGRDCGRSGNSATSCPVKRPHMANRTPPAGVKRDRWAASDTTQLS